MAFTIDPNHQDYPASLVALKAELDKPEYQGLSHYDAARALGNSPQTGTEDILGADFTIGSLFDVLGADAANLDGADLSRAVGYIKTGQTDMVEATLDHWIVLNKIDQSKKGLLNAELAKTKTVETKPVYGLSPIKILGGSAVTDKMVLEARAL